MLGKSRFWESTLSALFDLIKAEFLKNAADILAAPLTLMMNQTLEGGVPEDVNTGIGTLIHKSGPREDLLNYRPITVSSALLALLTKELARRIQIVVEREGILSEGQNGFRPRRSTLDNLFILMTLLDRAKSTKV